MLMISLMNIERKAQHSHAHAMLRECLRPYGIDYNDDTPVSRGKMGKPSLADRPDVHFNLSHADGVTACIVSGRECGIDCEGVRPFRQNVIRRVFSEKEKQLFEAAPEEEKNLLFFRLWTLKEAYVKAIGTGISFPMNEAEFSFADGEIICSQPDCSFRQYILEGGRFVVSVCELD
ncbi:MAG: 4'-phosphopantetheinyl transferase superfamily protein [Ruminococcus sp.]|nr:4'-phosphopantetheinyl transferase superfamily protein [Ruminococcus sp.]